MTKRRIIIVSKSAPQTAKRRKPKGSKFNAVTNGAYTTGLLPWESQEEYDRHRAEFVKTYRPVGYVEYCLVGHMGAILWQYKRTELMTGAAMHRHEFGRAVMEAGAQSWQEANRLATENLAKTLNSIPELLARAIKIAGELKQAASGSDDVLEGVEKIGDACTKTCDLLQDVDVKLGLERDFFESYIPQKLDQIVRVQNALLAQFDKIHSRLQIIQEARLRREQLLLKEQQEVAVGALLSKAGNRQAAEDVPPSNASGTQSDALDGCDWPSRHPHSEDDLQSQDDLEAEDDQSGTDPFEKFIQEGAKKSNGLE
jgi:hypothetical protein